MQKAPVQVSTLTCSDKMSCEGTVLLTYNIKYPFLKTRQLSKPAQQINSYYQKEACAYEACLRKKIYPQAVDAFRFSAKHHYPVMAYEAEQVFNVTFLDSNYLSLYFDRYLYTGGAHGTTTRFSDTWDLCTGRKLPLSAFFPSRPDYEQALVSLINWQIATERNTEDYYENYAKETLEEFNTCQYYMTPQGIMVYYQQYDIAPYSTGLPEFLIPFGAQTGAKA